MIGYLVIGVIMLGVASLGMIADGGEVASTPLGPLLKIFALALVLAVPAYIIERLGTEGGRLHHVKIVRLVAGFISYMRGMSFKGRILQLVALLIAYAVVSAFGGRNDFMVLLSTAAGFVVFPYVILSVALMLSDLLILMGLGTIIGMMMGDGRSGKDRHQRGSSDTTADVLARELDKEKD